MPLPVESEGDSRRDERDPLVDEETAAAAAEARAIGGRVSRDSDDPAMVPVDEAGGGVAEGFEQAEADLIDNASHGSRPHDPAADAFGGERESDRAGASYADADHEHSSERADAGEREPDDGDVAGA
jgi:hypothetical protein